MTEKRGQNAILITIITLCLALTATIIPSPSPVAISASNAEVTQEDLVIVPDIKTIFIGEDESLMGPVHRLSFESAMMIAAFNGLKVLKTEKATGIKDGIDVLEAMMTDREKHEIVVIVHPGDTFIVPDKTASMMAVALLRNL